jgi:hypothetical protein
MFDAFRKVTGNKPLHIQRAELGGQGFVTSCKHGGDITRVSWRSSTGLRGWSGEANLPAHFMAPLGQIKIALQALLVHLPAIPARLRCKCIPGESIFVKRRKIKEFAGRNWRRSTTQTVSELRVFYPLRLVTTSVLPSMTVPGCVSN